MATADPIKSANYCSGLSSQLIISHISYNKDYLALVSSPNTQQVQVPLISLSKKLTMNMKKVAYCCKWKRTTRHWNPIGLGVTQVFRIGFCFVGEEPDCHFHSGVLCFCRHS